MPHPLFGLIAGIVLLAAPAVSAETLEERFDRLSGELTQGVGGYLEPVRPLQESVGIAYRASGPWQRSTRTLTKVDLDPNQPTALFEIAIDHDVETTARDDGLLVVRHVIRRFAVDHNLPETASVDVTNSIPVGTSMELVIDPMGRVLDIAVSAPDRAAMEGLPPPDSAAFAEWAQRVAPAVLAASAVVQNQDVFVPVESATSADGTVTQSTGGGRVMRGRTECAGGACFVIEIAKTVTVDAEGQSFVETAQGHVLVEESSMYEVGAVLGVRTAFVQGDNVTTTETIVVSTSTRPEP